MPDGLAAGQDDGILCNKILNEGWGRKDLPPGQQETRRLFPEQGNRRVNPKADAGVQPFTSPPSGNFRMSGVPAQGDLLARLPVTAFATVASMGFRSFYGCGAAGGLHPSSSHHPVYLVCLIYLVYVKRNH
jgi:hypothetical protein